MHSMPSAARLGAFVYAMASANAACAAEGPARTAILNAAIPELTAWVLMLVGAASLGALARRRPAPKAAFRAPS
jgi:hypothetical protein